MFRKAGAVAIVCLVVLVAIYAAYAALTHAEPELYILQPGQRGLVVVVFDMPNATAREYLGETRVYRIPESGILISEFPRNVGWLRRSEKQVSLDENGVSRAAFDTVILDPSNAGEEVISHNLEHGVVQVFDGNWKLFVHTFVVSAATIPLRERVHPPINHALLIGELRKFNRPVSN